MNDQQALFEEIFDRAKAKLPASVEARAQKGALMLHDKHWCDEARQVTVNFKLTASNRIALHVETLPFQSRDAVAMENKNTLVKKIRKALDGFVFTDYKEYGARNGWGTHDSTAVGYVKIDPANVGYTAGVLAKLYVALEPYIDDQF